jgi:hypothetical protein
MEWILLAFADFSYAIDGDRTTVIRQQSAHLEDQLAAEISRLAEAMHLPGFRQAVELNLGYLAPGPVVP